MSEWWTYRPSDFLMFAPRTYWRLFELQHEALWPAHAVLLALALALLAVLWRPHPAGLRAGVLGLALATAWVAWDFLWRRYAPINWAASGFAWGFALMAVGLLALARQRPAATGSPWRQRTGQGLVAWAALAHPLLAWAAGRPWVQAEVIGLAPDPTAIATLGLLLCTDARPRTLVWLLRAGAMAWLLVSAATLATMGSPQAAVPLVAVLLALAALWRGRATQRPVAV